MGQSPGQPAVASAARATSWNERHVNASSGTQICGCETAHRVLWSSMAAERAAGCRGCPSRFCRGVQGQVS